MEIEKIDGKTKATRANKRGIAYKNDELSDKQEAAIISTWPPHPMVLFIQELDYLMK